MIDTVGGFSVLTTRAPIIVISETYNNIDYKLASSAGPINRWQTVLSAMDAPFGKWNLTMDEQIDVPAFGSASRNFTIYIPAGVTKVQLSFTARHVRFMTKPRHIAPVLHDTYSESLQLPCNVLSA
jgi:hypothetical protein